jgi:hypothetical protein
MKSRSITKNLDTSATTSLGGSLESPTCDCKNPPGGTVRCEPGQIPVCIVHADGTVEGRCLTPPKSITSGAALRSWIRDELLGQQIEAYDVSSVAFDAILINQEVDLPNGTNIRFRIPPELL